MAAAAPPVVELEGVAVTVTTAGRRRTLLEPLDWRVEAGEHWAIVGPNGAGKTTLLRVASAQRRPSAGTAKVAGGQLGKIPLQELRRKIGFLEPALGRRFHPEQRALDVVVGGATATIGVDAAGPQEIARADAALAAAGVGGVRLRPFATCSEGERTRILLARALMVDADLLVLDEPAAALDVAGRELLLAALDRAQRARPGLATLTVTHRLEELPATTTHALLLRDGSVVARGPLAEAVTDETLSTCFGLPLRVAAEAGRLFVRAA
jgi:iron complex transport system ATP-binding protein